MAAAIQAQKSGLAYMIATPHKGLAETLQAFGINARFLPNVVEDLKPVKKLEGLNIGILGSGMPWKNMECQIIAARMLDPNARIHIQELKHPEIIDALGIKVERHTHIQSDSEYYELVGGMTINMVASLSEVYSYFTAESLLLGTPILTLPITPIMNNPEMIDYFTESRFENPIALRDQLTYMLDSGNYENLQKDGREHMLRLNAENKVIVAKVMEELNADL